MHFPRRLTLASSLGALVAAAGLVAPPQPAAASDIEVFFSKDQEITVKPNVLFILDTSQSMYIPEPNAPEKAYNPTTTYPGACAPAGYYWTSVGGALPDCGTGWARITADQFSCTEWKKSVNKYGYYTRSSRVAQKDGAWRNMTAYPNQKSLETACQGDNDVSGIDWSRVQGGKPVYPVLSYTFLSGNWINWANSGTGESYRIDLVRESVGRLFTTTDGIKAGLMRFGFDGARKWKPGAPLMCENLEDINGDGVIDANDEATLSSNGAPMLFPVTDLDGDPVPDMPGATVREQIRYQLGLSNEEDTLNENLGWYVDPKVPTNQQPFQIVQSNDPATICPIPLMAPGGRSPLGGAMTEAYLYFAGKEWSQKYGRAGDLSAQHKFSSVPQSRVSPGSGTYKSPIDEACAKNFIVLLSDGTTEQDNDIDGTIEKLPGFRTATGSTRCDTDPYLDATGQPPPSQCVDDIAEYLYETDLSQTVPSVNNVITYTIGFRLGTDPKGNAARQLLSETATRGGGSFYEVGTMAQLEDVFSKIVREILTENTSFSAPAVTVNAFNRTQNLNSLYMSLFRPAFNYRWIGNIKRYELDPIDGDILDSLGNPAVDPANGFFRTNSRSFWSPFNDGSDIAVGGAANRLPAYGSRRMLTTASGSMVKLADAGLNDADVGIQAGDLVRPSVTLSPPLTATDLVAWFQGKDLADEDGDTITDETRLEMGDPLHSRPATVIYGGNQAKPDLYDDALFVVTNDGVLHAIDPTNPADETLGGTELWSFVPRNLVGRMRDLYYNRILQDPEDRGYGLDANIRVLRIDNNNNGIIETADEVGKRDKVYLYFGQRRGGSSYYALDVSTKLSPKLMWASDYAIDDEAGQSWSSPVPARVRIGTTEKLVLVFGGGYDTDHDDQPFVDGDRGAGVYMVDALTGALIWRAGSDSGANLRLEDLRNAIPGDVRVIDLTGDGFADRMYAADLGGRIWRFDIFNGKPASGTEGLRLVEGGVIASLGNAEDGSGRDQTNTLRFFYSPDPALITRPGPNFINIAIGSGHRELPGSDLTTRNWFFSVRDYNVFTPLLSSWYQSDCSAATTPCHEVILEEDLKDLTDIVGDDATAAVPVAVPGGVVGWKILLEETGEKVLAEARTFQDSVFFTTYSPVETGITDDTCGIKFGLNKLYVVNAVDARPIYQYDSAVGESVEDRSKDLAQGSIAPEVVFVFPTPPTDASGQQVPAVPPVCLVGLENCGFGITNPPVRTYWRQRGAN